MRNQNKGFSPELQRVASPGSDITRQDEEAMRKEFEVMQKLDFAFIKEIGASNAEEYMIKITSLKFAQRRNSKSK